MERGLPIKVGVWLLMSDIFLISDQHFGHSKPYTTFLREDGTLLRPHGSFQIGDEAMIENHNKVVRQSSKVYFLGDVFMTTKSQEIDRIMYRLNGEKVLIKGNHDVAKLDIYARHFKDVRAYHVLANLALSHVPLHPDSISQRCLGNVHGHLHYHTVKDSSGKDDPRYLNVSVERINYTPIALEEVIRHFKS